MATRGTWTWLVAVGLACLGMATGCAADDASGGTAGDYPSKSIRWTVPYPPGGGTDATSRIVATCMEDELGQTIVVENVDGASGARGTQELANATPDGYTVGLAITTGVTVTPMIEDVPFDQDSVDPIGAFADIGMFIGVGKDSAYTSIDDVFAAAEQNPGTITVGMPGASSPKVVAFRALAAEYGLEFQEVPLEGTSGVVTALIGNQVDVAGLDADVVAEPQVTSGEIRPLAMIGDAEWSAAPDVPTLAELGYERASLPNYQFYLATPNGVPDEVSATLEEALRTCVEDTEVVEALGGPDYVPAPFMGPDDVKASLDQHVEMYEPYMTE